MSNNQNGFSEIIKRLRSYEPSRWEKIWWPIRRFFIGLWSFFRYDIPYGIENLWVFKKAIWQYRWWEYAHLLAILKITLSFMADKWRKYSYHADAEEIEAILRELVRLLDKYEASYYEDSKTLRKFFNILKDNIERFWD